MAQRVDESYLITGAAGFIGSHLTRRLVHNGNDVHVLVRSTSDLFRIADLKDRVKVHTADVTDASAVTSVIEAVRPDGVFHLAASNIRRGVTAGDKDVVNVNILGVRNLLEALKNHVYRFFIQTGSFLEYGVSNRPVRETDRCEPSELYSVTKLAATRYGQAVAKRAGKPIVGFRIFTPYGPAIQPKRLVCEVISHALKNEPIDLTVPDVSRDFIFVEDLVNLLIEASQKANDCKGHVFNAGSGVSTPLKDFLDAVVRETNSLSQLNWNKYPLLAYDSKFWQADMEKTFNYFDWRPQHNVEEGIKKTVEWFKNNYEK